MIATEAPPVRLIGIAGGSGSGKTTLARYLHRHLGRRAALVSADWYYRDRARLTATARARINFDHPRAMETARLAGDLLRLRRRLPVLAPRYCYQSHCRFDDGAAIRPAEVILVEGLFVLHEEKLRSLFDLTVFVDLPPDVRLTRRLRRDAGARGIPLEETLRVYERQVRPMHDRFVQPSAQHATHVWQPLADRRFPRQLVQEVTALLS